MLFWSSMVLLLPSLPPSQRLCFSTPWHPGFWGRHMCVLLCSWDGGRRIDLPEPRCHPCPLPAPGRGCPLCLLLAASGSGTQHHSDRTVLRQPSERADSWTKARFLHLLAGATAPEGARPISSSQAPAKGRCLGGAGRTDGCPQSCSWASTLRMERES